jgi:hypothetical protein
MDEPGLAISAGRGVMDFNSPDFKRDDTTHHGILVSQCPYIVIV